MFPLTTALSEVICPPGCMPCSREYKSCYLMWMYTKGVRGCWSELTELLTAYTTIPPCVVMTGKRSSTVGDSEIWSTHKESLYSTWLGVHLRVQGFCCPGTDRWCMLNLDWPLLRISGFLPPETHNNWWVLQNEAWEHYILCVYSFIPRFPYSGTRLMCVYRTSDECYWTRTSDECHWTRTSDECYWTSDECYWTRPGSITQ